METVERQVQRVGPHGTATASDLLVVEEPIELRLGGVPLAVLMRTPGDDRRLALGFCLTEGILLDPGELLTVMAIDGGSRYELQLREGVAIDPEQFRRRTYASSSCGICGKATIDAVRLTAPRLPRGPVVSAQALRDAIDRLVTTQVVFAKTGGLHGAAILDPGGELLAAAEDVGRHNAVDKVVGALAPSRWPIGEAVLAISGRVSFEIVQKAAVAGIPIVIGVSAASSLAIDLAQELGMTIAGFVRNEHFTLYAGSDRLLTTVSSRGAGPQSPSRSRHP